MKTAGSKDLDKYQFEIRELSADEGGGFLVSYPDFNECIADGETMEEALQNGRQALADVLAALKEAGLPIPKPMQNPFDALARHAIEESRAGRTVTLEDFERRMKKSVSRGTAVKNAKGLKKT
ncbi:MAG TPA: hypothetical protein DCG57_03390 [Candidatus Riflebacteria bacterium]|jgi:predicted RNase H-like HicB family nuclease|nr:hypothetical protein [Candidatus Riflebacteria bacterium]